MSGRLSPDQALRGLIGLRCLHMQRHTNVLNIIAYQKGSWLKSRTFLKRSMCCYSRPDFVLVRQNLRDAGEEYRSLLLGLKFGGVPSINSINAIYNFQVKHIQNNIKRYKGVFRHHFFIKILLHFSLKIIFSTLKRNCETIHQMAWSHLGTEPNTSTLSGRCSDHQTNSNNAIPWLRTTNTIFILFLLIFRSWFQYSTDQFHLYL